MASTKSKRPVDVYKEIIDGLVERGRTSVSTRLVREDGIFSKAPADKRYNAFVASLSQEQRTVLAEMLEVERSGAFHDVLADLTWWITTQGVALTHAGKPMPVELSGMGLHGDYVGRASDWEWPQD